MNLQDVPSSLWWTLPCLAQSSCISHRHIPLKRSSPSSKICGPSGMGTEIRGVLRSYTSHIHYTAKLLNGHCWSEPLHISIYYRKSTHCKYTSLTLRPNHEELLAIYDQPCTISTFQELQERISPVIHHLLDVVGVGSNGQGAVVVRCGRHGSCVGTRAKGIKWFPAYFTEKDGGRVIDVSGGNSNSSMIGSMELTKKLVTRT
jgi:hypothetical protein